MSERLSKKQRRQIGREQAPLGVNGGHRAGKRKRGNSLTKLAPKVNTRATLYEVRDPDGVLIATTNIFVTREN